MFRRTLLLSAMATIGFAPMALASLGHDVPNAVSKAAPGIRLAQAQEVDTYFDRYGRRVLVDPNTGEVLAVEPRRITRQEWRRLSRQRELRRERRYDDDQDYEDGVVVEAPRLRPRRDEIPDDDYSQYPDPDYPDRDLNEYPAAPGESVAPAPKITKRAPVERKKLGPVPAIRDDQPEPKQTETASVEPDQPTATEEQPTTEPTIVAPDVKVEPTLSSSSRPEVAALQVLLDRFGASPGVVDGRFGSNVDKALAAYRQITGDNLKSTDEEGIKKRLADSGGDAFASYEITPQDVAGPFVASVPEDYSQKAKLDRLGFTSVTEALAERFHMDEGYLKALNPQADWRKAGTLVKVANFGKMVTTPVARITADKGKKQVRAYDAAGKLVAAYPATIGSEDTPSPTGNHAVSRVALDPNYTYNPKINFKQGDNADVLTIPPGPNGPVGSVWIALDKPTYGIHGTPEPSKIGKTESHGCVRLTNWDAQELAKLVKAGVMVEFIE